MSKKRLDVLENIVEKYNTWLFYIHTKDSISLEDFIKDYYKSHEIYGQITCVFLELET